MAIRQAPRPEQRHLSRPGHEAVVAACLEDLQGPVHGQVELPIWLFWHPDRTFDLDKPGMLAWVYQIVLREARGPADLARLNGDRLIALWPELVLPKGVRRAWEEQHPALRAAAPARA
ncbi:MAG TPA: hypothetical protein VMI33_14820 [Streptosporangiaceae bacterium]|nr:hypothetical protein [Streptosporangiaceae bacterium]